jgi:hypothetical protein
LRGRRVRWRFLTGWAWAVFGSSRSGEERHPLQVVGEGDAANPGVRSVRGHLSAGTRAKTAPPSGVRTPPRHIPSRRPPPRSGALPLAPEVVKKLAEHKHASDCFGRRRVGVRLRDRLAARTSRRPLARLRGRRQRSLASSAKENRGSPSTTSVTPTSRRSAVRPCHRPSGKAWKQSLPSYRVVCTVSRALYFGNRLETSRGPPFLVQVPGARGERHARSIEGVGQCAPFVPSLGARVVGNLGGMSDLGCCNGFAF